MEILTDTKGRHHFLTIDIHHLPTGEHINGLQFYAVQYVNLSPDYYAK